MFSLQQKESENLWQEIKTIQHAFKRYQRAGCCTHLHELDRDRLTALCEIFRSERLQVIDILAYSRRVPEFVYFEEKYGPNGACRAIATHLETMIECSSVKGIPTFTFSVIEKVLDELMRMAEGEVDHS